MDEKEIKDIMEKVNRFLSRQLWMDFEIIEYSKQSMKIIGSIDISALPVMELIFEDVFFASTVFNWATDTRKTVISLLEGKDAKAVNMNYRVEQGYHIIKIAPEDYPEEFGCIFGVKKIYFNLLHPEK